ncbi:hypothetical protein [Mongoliitalea daihaiensis]|uniref:hypothetical protein n=1 Tax=Mongoliitalea daihaiensis TaxID=2782006 RepID=UPI001F2FAADB|nr:hypothetical protein [Mongoliitalea daihaiensis]UJP66897.1 hypothetical protein IPZ59_10040 [Mongoliitalea daihaiensis]
MLKYFIFVFVLISCSSPKEEEHQSFFNLSEKKFIEFNKIAIVPDYPFPPYVVYQEHDSIIFFNSFTSGLSSLTLYDEQFRYSDIESFKKLGEPTIGGMPYLFIGSKNFRGVGSTPVIDFYNKNLEWVSSLNIFDLEVLKDYQSPSLKGPNSFQIGIPYNGVDSEKDRFYFFVSDYESDLIDLIAMEIASYQAEVLPPFYDKKLINSQKIKHENFSLEYLPFVLYHNDSLIVSYNYHSKIDVFNLIKQKSSSLEISTLNYPFEKVKKPKFTKEMSFKNMMELASDWDGEVAFGELIYFKSCGCYYRTVKGPIKSEKLQDFDVFLELFDINLNKIEETNLSKINSNLSNFTIPLNGKILIKAKSQPGEDRLYFYYLELDMEQIEHLDPS